MGEGEVGGEEVEVDEERQGVEDDGVDRERSGEGEKDRKWWTEEEEE